MLDFLRIVKKTSSKGLTEIYPTFSVKSSSDLMIRGGDFYAIWNEDTSLWSTNEEVAIDLIDREIDKFIEENEIERDRVVIRYMWDADSGVIDRWHKYVQKQTRDSFHPLDETISFANSLLSKTDYASKRLGYSIKEGDISAYDELMSILYSPTERHKIEWAIGSIVSGESKNIQKFLVMYGAAGTGKSTVLNIIQDLFDGYYCVFDAKALGSASNSFALEAFKSNPLVAIQHDGDLSRIEDNTRLNSVVSHELMTVNEKFKSTYENRFKCFLFMGTNKPVKITDAKSGILRRLIDVSPTGKKIEPKRYKTLIRQIKFELGAIAEHCLRVYLDDPGAYDDYIPIQMLGASNDFYNFMLDSYMMLSKDDGITLKAAYDLYKKYCEDAKVPYPYSRMIFKEELKNYFKKFDERAYTEDNVRVWNYYSGFIKDKFLAEETVQIDKPEENPFECNKKKSLFDELYSDCPAQYANEDETPTYKWTNVKTTLNDIDTKKVHYVKVPENMIVIDFDIKNDKGEKDYKLNLEAAKHWPRTYAELSKGGQGLHLHYIYDGDISKLSRVYDDDIEVKVFTGNSSLRRRLSKCNDIPIATINSGLPLRKEKKTVNSESIKTEKALRKMILRNLKKEIHPATAPSVDFIYKLLEDAYENDISYDVSDLKDAVFAFAANSSHQSKKCMELVDKMHFVSKNVEESRADEAADERLVFFDCEVFPNLFMICWKFAGEENPVITMVNPKPEEVEALCRFKLVGYNCRRYDNHMLKAAMMHRTTEQIYELSRRIIVDGDRNAFYGDAYNISYTDIYDFASEKKSLKKWEIELGIHHQELPIPWDQPVPKERWEEVAGYCTNDVIATEAVFNARKGDWVAREILAAIAGGTVNDTTNQLTTKLIFGSEKNPELVYTDLSIEFPGYSFEHGEDNKNHNMYRGVDLGFGGYVYSDPGMYNNVALLDVASLHPHSIIAMNCFGDYTKNFSDLVKARIYIKHKEFDKAKDLFDGKLALYLDDPSNAKALSQALKIAINSVYGLTSASFKNPFRDMRNVNNIVALRGALFMKTLQDEVTARGFKVAHIKTDSIKIVDATNDIIKFCTEFAKNYGYTFEHEATYDRMCLVNDAAYIAKYATVDKCYDLYSKEYVDSEKDICKENKEHGGSWTATAAQFQVPYVFKTLFSHEPLEFNDFCETKEVKQGELYLDFNEGLGHDEHNYKYVGRIGSFCPINDGSGGGELYRVKDGKYYAAAGTKGYRWMESEVVKTLGKEDAIDKSYYISLSDKAIDTINEYGDFNKFTE